VSHGREADRPVRLHHTGREKDRRNLRLCHVTAKSEHVLVESGLRLELIGVVSDTVVLQEYGVDLSGKSPTDGGLAGPSGAGDDTQRGQDERSFVPTVRTDDQRGFPLDVHIVSVYSTLGTMMDHLYHT
jgi:hypothetical protein